MPSQTDPNQINTVPLTAPPDLPPMASAPKKKLGGGRIVATILGILLLVGGVGTGVYLTQQQQIFNQKAASNDINGGGQLTQTPSSTFNTGVSCQEIKAFKGTALLTTTDLSKLKPGEDISFCAFPIDAREAIFTINGVVQPAITPQGACMTGRGSCLCTQYTIPNGVNTFNVSARLLN